MCLRGALFLQLNELQPRSPCLTDFNNRVHPAGGRIIRNIMQNNPRERLLTEIENDAWLQCERGRAAVHHYDIQRTCLL